MISYIVCLCLPDLFHLAWCPPRPFMLLQMAKFHLFFYDWVIFSSYIYHIFFIHSYVHGPLDCFYILCIIIVLLWMLECMYLLELTFEWVFFFLDKYPGVELLGHIVVLGHMASLTQWTWVWANSGRQWRMGKPGLLQFMGSQRVRQELVTEQWQQ